MTDETLQAALPREMYVDDAHWAVEREAVLYGEWYCAGRVDDLGLAAPKRVVAVDVAGESVVVTSAEDGTLHAAYNVCRHRGAQLCTPGQPARDAGAIRCPYHSWTYGLDGALLKSPHADVPDPGAFSLHPVGVEVWAGFVFLHLTPGAAGPLREQVAHPAETLRNYGHRRAGDRRGAALRGGGQLQGAARELQRVLPLRPRAPGAVAAGAGVRRRWQRPRLGERDPPPRRRVDVHDDRDDHARAAARPRRARAHAPQGRPRLPEPDAVRVGRPRRGVRPAPARGRPHRGGLLAAVRARGGGRRRVRPERRGRAVGPGQQAGLGDLRVGAARDVVARLHARLVRADGGRQPRHPALAAAAAGARPGGGRG